MNIDVLHIEQRWEDVVEYIIHYLGYLIIITHIEPVIFFYQIK